MSSGQINQQLIDFLRTHPDYFEGPKDQQTIRKDLQASIRTYSRSIDPEAFEALRRQLVQFQAHSEERLKRKVAELLEQKAAEEQNLQRVMDEYGQYEQKLSSLKDKKETYEQKKQAFESNVTTSRFGDYMFLVLDIIGILFLYVGFILNEGVDYSFVIMGFVFFAIGFFMQKNCKKRVALEISPMNDIAQKLEGRSTRLQEIWKLKKYSLLERKRQSLSKIQEFDSEIKLALNKIEHGHH